MGPSLRVARGAWPRRVCREQIRVRLEGQASSALSDTSALKTAAWMALLSNHVFKKQ